MHLLFDDAGKPTTGRILSEADNSLQVELDSGKRVKVKSANAWLRFDKPEPSALMSQALALQAGMELPLAYEFAPEDEFDFSALAGVYFDDPPSPVQQAAALLCLQSAPHYFRRLGKGRFKKAPADILAQALVAIEKKQQVQAQIEAWAAELVSGTCPSPVRAQLYKILFKPDKNSPEYKAVVQAARDSHTAPLTLLLQSGAIENAYEFHWQRFLFEHFPKGTGFGELAVPCLGEELPLADVQAFSIDDSQTTEIDDALSVQGLGTGCVTLGIHIAAPALSIDQQQGWQEHGVRLNLDGFGGQDTDLVAAADRSRDGHRLVQWHGLGGHPIRRHQLVDRRGLQDRGGLGGFTLLGVAFDQGSAHADGDDHDQEA